MFGWLSHLVEQGLMDEFEVSFLVVGHTHCSIDQYFSTISGYIRKKADFIPTPDAMRYLLTVCHHDECRRPDPRFVRSLKVMNNETIFAVVIINNALFHLKVIYDYKTWLGPVLSSDIKYLSVPHRFKISLVSKKACLQYMHFTGDYWLPQLPRELSIPILPADFCNVDVALPDDHGKCRIHL
jgi:hypothetical protein